MDERENLSQLRFVLRDLHYLAQQLQGGLTLDLFLERGEGLAGVQHIRLTWTDLLESESNTHICNYESTGMKY